MIYAKFNNQIFRIEINTIIHTFPDLQSAAHCASASQGAYDCRKVV